MKRSFLCILLAVLLALGGIAAADTNLEPETFGGIIVDEDWSYVGYTYGGITFAIPKESYVYELSAYEKSMGILLLYGNEDYMLQLRVFMLEQATYEAFKRASAALRTQSSTCDRTAKRKFYATATQTPRQTVSCTASPCRGSMAISIKSASLPAKMSASTPTPTSGKSLKS